mmetsp:Transcript_9955/g.12417  ORF Transcript_9955/g.12417 Transcript_9955/m.12417 type:complete len:132 (+) Transcript_9955:187-582(+)|eukprot:CAMPEP_0204867106 /NCGR_PEP_ID=MMETSP1348-20121228/20896_1 /ASSEMBLY_ACC=CAM_ASM_000700 /TAXON_ID=215587 /ORGANISM="Aplanochytrium stocchinoi, Strain GSBS06" /LENGTH=131 /DNA_ID=CAMNT_0052019341 /DNA_START=156 /DNA_END=551 /DNA_ORIENTATION=-
MATPLKGPPAQEMAPKGGYKMPAGNFARYQPKQRMSGALIFGGVAFMVCYGFYGVGQGNIKRRALRQERRERRAAIIPFLQAEEDVRYTRARAAQIDVEKRIMADVPGWEAGKSPFNSGRFMPPGDTNIIG